MNLKENYNYRFISKNYFDSKYLEIETFNDEYRKYKIVKYKKNEEIRFAEIVFEHLIKNIENVIKIYDAEKIVSNCKGPDARYENLTYYHIDDLYFIEFSDDYLGNDNENDLVKRELEIKGLI